MRVTVMDGREVAQELSDDTDATLDGIPVISLAVVRTESSLDDAGADAYERSIVKVGKAHNVAVEQMVVEDDHLQDTLNYLSRSEEHDFILPLRPYPNAHLSLSRTKDVDMVGVKSQGMMLGKPKSFGSTADAVLTTLDHYAIQTDGAMATVIGRSEVVGKPISLALESRNATVALCHSRTPRGLLRHLMSESEIVVSATGRPLSIGLNDLQGYSGDGITFVDVGTSLMNGRLTGDIDSLALAEAGVARAYTPVPHGIGAITTEMLFNNMARRFCQMVNESD